MRSEAGTGASDAGVTMNEWQKIRLRHGLIAALVAIMSGLLGSLCVYFAITTVWQHPHDPMDGLTGIMFGVPAGLVIGVIAFDRMMRYLHLRAWNKQESVRLRVPRS